MLLYSGWRPIVRDYLVNASMVFFTALGRAGDRGARSPSYRHVTRMAAIPVTTSVRPTARTPYGFSSYLRSLGVAASQSIGRPTVTAMRAPDTKLASSDASMT